MPIKYRDLGKDKRLNEIIIAGRLRYTRRFKSL